MKILCFGSLNIDKVYNVPHFVRPGETLSALDFQEFCGGKGLNQSIALAKAGGHVYHAGCIGASDGKKLLSLLESEGVNTSMVRELQYATGHAIIQVDSAGQNCIVLFGGANQQITGRQIDDTLSQFDSGDILVLQNEINGLEHLIKKSAERGMTVVFNPSPMTEDIRSLPLEHVNYFILNEVEARDLCGEELACSDYPARIQQLFPDSKVVLTLGSRGSIYREGNNEIYMPACQVKAVDTTAAGDTFTGYFISAIASGESVKTALSLATRAAAIAVSRAGASASIPEKEEVLAFPEPIQ